MIKTFEEYSAYNRLTETTKAAAAELADAVMETIAWDFLKNATDLGECDNTKISWIISLANDDAYFCKNLDAELYSIKEIFQQKKHIRCVDVIEKWVEENWEEYLDEDTVDALNDFFDMGGILGKKQLNGGRFEAFREFQILVEDNVINKIKETLQPADHDDDDDEEDDD